MSHFTVLVIGPDVERQLAPFHEFECTGRDDQYVQDVDRTEEARAQFAKETSTVLRMPDGTLQSFFDEAGNWRPEFSKPDPDTGFLGDCNRRTYHVPDGCEKVKVPTSQVESFAEWAAGYYGAPIVPFGEQPDKTGEHKYGYTLVGAAGEVVKVVDRTNPNKKWDWFEIGGRWSGFFKLKAGRIGSRGERGVMGSCRNAGPGYADQLRKGDIDVEGMREDAALKALSRWDAVHAVIKGRTWRTWEQVRDIDCKGDINLAREVYNGQPVVFDAQNSEGLRDILGWNAGVDEFACTREEIIELARRSALQTFAVLKDGQWAERGDMGWFGCVRDEKDPDAWSREFAALIDSLPDDTILTVVDCHI